MDYATNNHITEDIVLDEVDRCIEVSAATSFVVRLSVHILYAAPVNEETTLISVHHWPQIRQPDE